MDREQRNNYIQQGICEGIAQKDKAALLSLVLSVISCSTFLYLPFWLFVGIYLICFCLVMIPGIFLMKDDDYKELSGEDKQNCLKGFAQVIMNANLKVFASISFVFILYLFFGKEIIIFK